MAEAQNSRAANKVQAPATYSIKIEGKEYDATVLRIELDQRVDDHHSLRIYIADTAKGGDTDQFLDANLAKDYLGNKITLTVGVEGVDGGTTFVGIVTQFSLINSVDGLNTLRLTVASPTVSMDGALRYTSYAEAKSSDAISQTISQYSNLPKEVAATAHVWTRLVQHNETDWAFIRRLASADGLFCTYDGEKLLVEKANTAVASTLVFRQNMGSFTLGIGVEQPKYNTTYYGFANAKLDRLSAKEAKGSGLAGTAIKASKQLFTQESLKSYGLHDVPNSGADNLLENEAKRAVDRMIEGEGTSIDPTLRAGITVDIQGIGSGSSGAYFVTAVSHRLEGGQYENTFHCRPVEAAFPQQAPAPTIEPGLHRAFVTDNDDPEKLGRVKVESAWYDPPESDWLRVISPYAGKEYGWYVVPEISDEVLVGYMRGDVNDMVVFGSIYNKKALPKGEWVTPDNDHKVFHTMAGNIIDFNDESGKETITITTAKEACILTLSTADKCVTIKSTGDIKLDADGSINLEAKEDIVMKATGDVKVEGMNVGLKATTAAKVEGMNVEAKGTASFKASGAQAELSGSAMTTIKGGMVMIN